MMSQTKKQMRLALPLTVIAALVLLLSGSGMAQGGPQDSPRPTNSTIRGNLMKRHCFTPRPPKAIPLPTGPS